MVIKEEYAMKDGDTIKIKCPECGAVLTAIYQSKVKVVKCPVCKQTHLFAEFKTWQPIVAEGTDTNYEQNNETLGELIDLTTGKTYRLSSGVNTIGRKAKTSTATVQIETTDGYMSRVHAEIKYENGFHFFRILSDKNEPIVNGQLVTKADSLILQGGERIKLGNTELLFRIPGDDDDTL